MAEKEVELSNEFPDISECKRNGVVSNAPVINDLSLCYVDHHNVLYNGHIICVKQSKKSQFPKVIIGRMMNAKKKGRTLQYHYTSHWQIIYNGRPKFGCNVYLTM